ncbi:phage major tail protein, phi13 family [Clostridium sp. USBA 49]|uniref:major tail protein n=1 Tax=Clostridium sp. USBA 49 TaxID=1881060 RepID=UPI00099A743D|nr:major tail protein [Clostridium sp. USBA 49]SKA89706.1 phage major tail protein, phi13 family [Clostridium sp. USBA 49]
MAVKIGMKDLYYAKLTKDDKTGVTYETPELISGAISAKISPKSDTQTLYADDGAFETTSQLSEITVEIEMADLPLTAQSELLGHTLTEGVLEAKNTDVAPYVAIGFRALKSNGKYRYYWLLKGKFEIPDDESQTKEDKAKFQTAKIKGTFVSRIYDGKWKLVGDEDETGFDATGWFSATKIGAGV